MADTRNNRPTKRTSSPEAAALDALNARARSKAGTRRLIEATIEEKARKRRKSEGPLSSRWKSSA